jgi:predicted nucleic acid-binding protein
MNEIAIVDAGALVALNNARDDDHARVLRVFESYPGQLLIPDPVIAEVDYLLRELVGIDAELDFLSNLIDGTLAIEHLTTDDYSDCRDLIRRYRNLDIGLADASVVVVANRVGTRDLLTLDQRDFRVIVDRDGNPYTLLPFDGWKS